MRVQLLSLCCLAILVACGAARVPPDNSMEGAGPSLSPAEVEEVLKRGRGLLASGAFAEAATILGPVAGSDGVPADRRVLALAAIFMAWHLEGNREQEREAARRFFRPRLLTGSRDAALPAGAASELRWLGYTALRVVAASDAERRRAVAAGPGNPIPVLAPSEVGETLSWIRCGPRLEGSYRSVSVENRNRGGALYEVHRLRCNRGGGSRTMWFDLSLWYGFTATHLDGAEPPLGFTALDAESIVQAEFRKSAP
ncbi:MAG: hypothetical protein VX498_04290 [Myxococcota bacterium]|nr:hypothetical protein [Myxococcota bacterium]